jgi:sirohydrochlorin ferrochelatase
MTRPALGLVLHGTRNAAGTAIAEALTARVRRAAGGLRVGLCFADVRRPTVADFLSAMQAATPGPVVLVPAFLAAGYHVAVDVPAQVASSGRDDVALAAPLGPDRALVTAAADRLATAGWQRGDAVVFAAAGSSDPRAMNDVAAAARSFARRLCAPVHVGYVATGQPRVRDLVMSLRAAGAHRVAVASWLLAPGAFQNALANCGADVVADPLGTHSAVVSAILTRYHRATRTSSAEALSPVDGSRIVLKPITLIP